ncbi:hypothetical protein [Hymenobacter canadensis]|uniref:Phage abortive infection protein n=1 Tax=Hymenobacter canadensis TaxID=2999067 RepID=A0ABY7LMV9_9BACT|nr:hypothetical protein [Hymenobacter canadensis]WBA41781.1 hypothetical protein O3303_18460 [Hymenobacter canadensis]
MDIIFQNGEFLSADSSFLQEITTAAIGAALGAGGAIFVYWLQIQRDKDIKIFNEYKQSKADTEYFQLVLNDAVKFIESQILILTDYANKIIKQPYESHILNSYPTIPLFRLEKISHEKMHHIFLSFQDNNATKTIHDIYKYIDFYSESFKNINDQTDRDIKEVHVLKTEYVKLFADLADEFSKKANKIKYQTYNGNSIYKLDRLFTLIDKVTLDFYDSRSNTTDLTYHQNEFVRPLVEGIIQGGHLNDSDCINLAISSKSTTHKFTDIAFKNKNLGEFIHQYCNALSNNIEFFKSSIEKISIKEPEFINKWYHFLYKPGQ